VSSNDTWSVHYRPTPRAREGFLRIASQIADHFGRVVADRVADDLVHAFELLERNPGAGHRRDDLTHNCQVLFWHVGPTLIAYRLASDGVHVLFVERAEVDWERMLAESYDP